LSEIKDQWKDFDVIGIDEGQFFDDIVEFAENAANVGKIVIVASLSATYYRTSFQNISELVPRAEKVLKLSAICKICLNKADFHFRFCHDSSDFVGGSEMYMPLCRLCHLQKTQEQNLMLEK